MTRQGPGDCPVCGIDGGISEPCPECGAPVTEQLRRRRWQQGFAVGYNGERKAGDPLMAAWVGSDVEWHRDHQHGWEAGRAARKQARREVLRELAR